MTLKKQPTDFYNKFNEHKSLANCITAGLAEMNLLSSQSTSKIPLLVTNHPKTKMMRAAFKQNQELAMQKTQTG